MCAKFNLMCPGCGNAFVTGAGTPEPDPSRTVHADTGDNPEIALGPVQSALDIPEKMRLADERLALARLMGPDHACLTVRQFDQLRDDLETERARREKAEQLVLELLLGQSKLPSKPDKQEPGHEDFVQKLKETFKEDSFAVQSKSPPIHKQSLMGPSQRAVAGILWMFLEGEWSQDWVSLAKLNMLQAGSDSAVIVSRSLPQPSLDLCRSEGVWMVRPSHAEPLAQVIRSSLVQAGEAKRESVDRILMSEQLHPW